MPCSATPPPRVLEVWEETRPRSNYDYMNNNYFHVSHTLSLIPHNTILMFLILQRRRFLEVLLSYESSCPSVDWSDGRSVGLSVFFPQMRRIMYDFINENILKIALTVRTFFIRQTSFFSVRKRPSKIPLFFCSF